MTDTQILGLRRGPFIAVAVALVAVVVASALILTNGDGDDADETVLPQFSEVEIDGSLPELEDPATDPARGQQAPVFTAGGFDGGRATIGDDGVARLIGFFAHWCPACQREVPVVADWLRSAEIPDGVEVIAVATATDADADNYPPSAWLSEEGWTARVLLDDESGNLATAYGLPAFPYWVAVGSDGTVLARFTGGIEGAELDQIVAELAGA